MAWVVLAYGSGAIRSRFWKRLAYGLLILGCVSLSILGDWSDQWRYVGSLEDQRLYLVGLFLSLLACIAVLMLEPIWRSARRKLALFLALTLLAHIALTAATRDAPDVSAQILHGSTFSAVLILLGILGLVWRVSTAKEYVEDDGCSRLLSR